MLMRILNSKIVMRYRIVNRGVDMVQVTIYTDGSCLGNPGPGGWACILTDGKREKVISGGEYYTTNNRMELTAVIKGLQCIKKPCDVEVVTDSKYIVDAFNKNWIKSWKKYNFKKCDGKRVKNLEYWQLLISLAEKYNVKFRWVKGHSYHTYNNRCDALAVKQAKRFRKSWTL